MLSVFLRTRYMFVSVILFLRAAGLFEHVLVSRVFARSNACKYRAHVMRPTNQARYDCLYKSLAFYVLGEGLLIM